MRLGCCVHQQHVWAKGSEIRARDNAALTAATADADLDKMHLCRCVLLANLAERNLPHRPLFYSQCRDEFLRAANRGLRGKAGTRTRE